jgi:integrase
MTTERPSKSRKRRGHGDGGIRKRPDGRWEATIDLGFADGKRKRKSLYGSTRREVAQKLDRAKQSVEQGLNLTAKRQTVGGWLDYWIEEIIKPEREATTYAAYETFSRLHIKPYLGQIALDKLQPEELERWLRELDRRGVGVRTRQCCLSRLRTALTLAMRRGYVVRNVAELVDPPASIRKKHQAPRMDDLKRLLDATREDRLHAMILVALGLGLRRGEVLGLKWEDIDLVGRTLTVRRHVVRTKQTGRAVLEGAKTDAGERTVMLPQLLVRALKRHKDGQLQDQQLAGGRWLGPDYLSGESGGFVFTSTIGTGIEPRRVNVYFSRRASERGSQRIRSTG